MDKKYTSLENTIKNVVRGSTGASQDNRSLESKIRSVVLKEEKVARNNIGDRVEINMPGAAAHGQSGILKSVDEDGMARVHLNPNMGATGTQTKMGSEDQTISGLNVRMGGTHTYVPLSRLKLFYPDNLDEEVSINEAPDDAAPPGENHLGVHELFGYLRDYNEDHDRSTDPEDPDEYGAKESRADINSTEKMIKNIHGQDTLDHVRNAIESERHIRLGTNPGVNNHQAVKAHLDAAVRASRHFSEALGTGGNEGGEFKGTPPAFFKPFHAEPKVGDTHPPSEGAAAASRNRAKIASSETMKKEGYVITPSGRKPLINEAELEEGSEKFAKIMARTAAKRGEPITTDTTELEKKHNELLQAHQDALAHAEQTKKDYEDLLRKYGSVQEDSLEERLLDFLLPSVKGGSKVAPEVEAGARAAGKLEPEISAAGKVGRVKGKKTSKLAKGIAALAAADQLLGGGGAIAAGGMAAHQNINGGDGGDISNLTVNRHYAKDRAYHGPEIHYNHYEPELNYIGEDSAEKADAERMAIQNVGRPNSKNKLAKQGEIQRKIIDENARRKEVILRAKEENKSGKDGSNSMVNTKPDLKHVHVHEDGEGVWGTVKKGLNKINPIYDPNMAADEYGPADLALDVGSMAPVVGAPLSAASAYRNLQKGNYGYAALDALGAVPMAGWLAKGAKATNLINKARTVSNLGNVYQVTSELPDLHNSIKDIQAQDQSSYGAAAGKVASGIGTVLGDTATKGYNDAKNWIAGKVSGSDSNSAAANEPETPGQTGSKGGNSSDQVGTTAVAPKAETPGQTGSTDTSSKESGSKVKSYKIPNSNSGNNQKTKSPATNVIKTIVAQSRPAKSSAGSDYEQRRTELLRANPNSVGAKSSLPPEARREAPSLPSVPVKTQTSPGINSTNTEAPRTMGSSWNNSYKNKYSMGPGPSQFPSK